MIIIHTIIEACVCWPEKVRVYVGQRKYHVHKICNTRFDLTCPLTLNFNTSARIIYLLWSMFLYLVVLHKHVYVNGDELCTGNTYVMNTSCKRKHCTWIVDSHPYQLLSQFRMASWSSRECFYSTIAAIFDSNRPAYTIGRLYTAEWHHG